VVSDLVPIEGSSIAWHELERRLLEMGFVEGAAIEILHEGPIKRDPIAVRVDETTVAVRRADAVCVVVRPVGAK
jgi:ferrous iron transport protein A